MSSFLGVTLLADHADRGLSADCLSTVTGDWSSAIAHGSSALCAAACHRLFAVAFGIAPM